MGFAIAFILGIFLSFVCSWGAVKFFPALGLLDFPQRYGLHRSRIPYPLGIVFCFLSLFLVVIDVNFLWIFIPIIIVGFVSFLDDRKPIRISVRLACHIISGVIIFFCGAKIAFIGNPFGEGNIDILGYSLVLSLLLTVVWIIVLQNALNWFDGVGGLSTGVSGIGFGVIGALGLVRPELLFDASHAPLTYSAFWLSGLCLGMTPVLFCHKAVLGDTGSQVMGMMLGIISIVSGAKIATTILVLLFPVIDLGMVIVRRLLFEKRHPFSSDAKHLPQNLCRKIGKNKAIYLIWGLSLSFGFASVFLVSFWKMISILLGVFIVLGLSLYSLQK